MGDDFGPLLPETGWVSVALSVVLAAVTVAVVLGVIIAVLRYRRSRVPVVPPQLPTAPPALGSRLAEIDGLLAAGRIDGAEHAAMRARILDLR